MKDCRCDERVKIRDKLIKSEDYVSNVEEISNIFALLGEVSRMKILLALLEGELCVTHICEITNSKQSVTSQHLRKLKDNKIYNTALYCRLSLDDGSVGESGSIQTQKIILEEF